MLGVAFVLHLAVLAGTLGFSSCPLHESMGCTVPATQWHWCGLRAPCMPASAARPEPSTPGHVPANILLELRTKYKVLKSSSLQADISAIHRTHTHSAHTAHMPCRSKWKPCRCGDNLDCAGECGSQGRRCVRGGRRRRVQRRHLSQNELHGEHGEH